MLDVLSVPQAFKAILETHTETEHVNTYFSPIKRKTIQNLFSTSLRIASKLGLRLKC